MTQIDHSLNLFCLLLARSFQVLLRLDMAQVLVACNNLSDGLVWANLQRVGRVFSLMHGIDVIHALFSTNTHNIQLCLWQ